MKIWRRKILHSRKSTRFNYRELVKKMLSVFLFYFFVFFCFVVFFKYKIMIIHWILCSPISNQTILLLFVFLFIISKIYQHHHHYYYYYYYYYYVSVVVYLGNKTKWNMQENVWIAYGRCVFIFFFVKKKKKSQCCLHIV